MHANSLKPQPSSGTLSIGSGAICKRVLFVDADTSECRFEELGGAAPRIRGEARKVLVP
jgi:hypothetical protein